MLPAWALCLAQENLDQESHLVSEQPASHCLLKVTIYIRILHNDDDDDGGSHDD